MNKQTGMMLFSHGWGANRYQHVDKMEWAVDRFNVVCLAVEYRMSGYDYNPATGRGAHVVYDASFYQVFDVLNAMRIVSWQIPFLNRSRFFHYGGSQGGHIALLGGIFAPNTFAGIFASCPLTRLTASILSCVDRNFADYELNMRDVIKHAGLINCPVYLEHGTNDSDVPHNEHTEMLVGQLKKYEKQYKVTYYEGGGHDLEPAITKLEAFKKIVPEGLEKLTRKGDDDFLAGREIIIPCGSKTLCIDWSKPADDCSLLRWADATG